jgi:hypothetical protein
MSRRRTDRLATKLVENMRKSMVTYPPQLMLTTSVLSAKVVAMGLVTSGLLLAQLIEAMLGQRQGK